MAIEGRPRYRSCKRCTAGVIVDPCALQAMDLAQRCGEIGYEVLVVALCARAGTLVTRLPAEPQ